MNALDVIRAEKSNIKVSAWSIGRVARKAFPLTDSKRLPAGDDWSWRLVEFDALQHHFRVLIRLNTDKEYYAAILGMDIMGGLAVICHHELHTSHRNWHCHVARGRISDIFVGVLRDRKMMRCWPSGSDCTTPFRVDRANAVTFAATRFRFGVQGDLL